MLCEQLDIIPCYWLFYTSTDCQILCNSRDWQSDYFADDWPHCVGVYRFLMLHEEGSSTTYEIWRDYVPTRNYAKFFREHQSTATISTTRQYNCLTLCCLFFYQSQNNSFITLRVNRLIFLSFRNLFHGKI